MPEPVGGRCETVPDGRVFEGFVLGGELPEALLFVDLVAEENPEVLTVDDVLHLGDDDATGLLVDGLIGPVGVKRSNLTGYSERKGRNILEKITQPLTARNKLLHVLSF